MTRKGLSITEVLVTLGVIAVVLVVLVPVLRGARDASRESRSLADVRALTALVLAYGADADSFPPSFASPADAQGDYSFLPFPDDSSFYFDIFQLWHHHVGFVTEGVAVTDELFNPDDGRYGPPSGAPLYTSYGLACSFAAQPSFWNERTRRYGPEQLRASRLTDVRFASRKSLLVSTWPYVALPDEERRLSAVLAGFVDGSADAVAPDERIAGYERGDGPSHQEFGARHFTDFPPMMHTIDGVLGRDRK
ncbi:MAG: hypothetical protein AAGI53_03230 [Planctomycetota bacterium]